MTHMHEEIWSQPARWREAAALAPAAAAALPAPGERVAVVGCGTSWFMAQAWARLREAAGAGETDAFTASDLPADRRYDRLVAITRSGTTTEIVTLLGELRGRLPITTVTAVPDAPVAAVSDAVVDLSFADERSVVQTVFATSVLAFVRASLGEDVGPLAAAAQDVLDAPDLPAVAGIEQITFLGSGWAWGLAQEAALKLRESCRLWTEAYPSMEYRHGPIAIAEPGRLVWLFGAPPAGLVADVAATGATVVDHRVDPLVELVRLHCLADALSAARGLDPDSPRSLSRAVILPSA